MKRDAKQIKVFTRRAIILGGAKVGLLSVLVGRMYYLQVVESDQYKVLADENRINLRLLPPQRGRILDRFGIELASNQQNYRVVLVAEQADDVEKTLDALGRLVRVPDHVRQRVLKEVNRRRGFVPVTVIENLTWEEFARINVNSPNLPGLQPDIGESRFYPFGRILAHVVGYVGAVSENDLDGDPVLELPGFKLGKNGVEKVREMDLRGKAGLSRVEVNAFGRVIRELTRDEGQPGQDVRLTIDSRLQEFVLSKLGEESASAAVLDIHTGAVLALGTAPNFDPHQFSFGLSQAQWKELVSNPRTPLVNKVISGQYPPGSTFKMMVALAALESGITTKTHRVFCRGKIKLGNATFHCWKRGGHGDMDLLQAIQQSCDVYFYDISKRVGVDRIAEMSNRFGLGQRTGIELPSEKKGLIPTRAWKQATIGVPWQQGETLVSGIGQGFVLTTPLQLAVMTARLANGGLAVAPRIHLPAPSDPAGAGAPDLPSIGVSRSSLAIVVEGMNRVSNSQRGTAFRARIKEKEFTLAGKTGTSQVRRITTAERRTGLLKNKDRPWKDRDHALFVAFAPLSAPRYAAAVVVEHGGSGSRVAAPLVRDILLEIQRLERQRREEPFAADLFPRQPAGRG
ncbi:MAG: penicillin-binding protein 2 [Proteobacteria bacterium]|nr:penicillin-binding protein 2 [Pseudomonadota bacterium]